MLSALLTLVLTQPSPVSPVQWRTLPGCPTGGQVQALAEELLLSARAEPIVFTGEIRLASVGYQLEVRARGTHREVTSDSCEMLGQAAALIIAVAYDPLAVAEAIDAPVQRPAVPVLPEPAAEPDPEREQDPDQDPDPEREPAAEPKPERDRTTERRPAPPRSVSPGLGGLARASFAVAGGILPSAGVGFELAGGLRWARWRVELGATGWLPRRAISDAGEEFGARTTLFAAAARACYVVAGPKVEVPLCAGPEVGGIWAEGFGDNVSPRTETQAWVAALGSAGVSWWVRRRLGIAARLEVPVGLYRPAVHLDGVGRVFRVGPVGVRVFVGPALRFR